MSLDTVNVEAIAALSSIIEAPVCHLVAQWINTSISLGGDSQYLYHGNQINLENLHLGIFRIWNCYLTNHQGSVFFLQTSYYKQKLQTFYSEKSTYHGKSSQKTSLAVNTLLSQWPNSKILCRDHESHPAVLQAKLIWHCVDALPP